MCNLTIANEVLESMGISANSNVRVAVSFHQVTIIAEGQAYLCFTHDYYAGWEFEVTIDGEETVFVPPKVSAWLDKLCQNENIVIHRHYSCKQQLVA